MEIVFTENSRKEFLNLDNSLQIQFRKNIEKLMDYPNKRHLKYGIPLHSIKVTKQARLIYDIENDKIVIYHCFANHKDYEKWYKSYI